MSRINNLLKAGAEDLENGQTFPNHEFLSEHEITSDEVFTLMDTAAIILRAFVNCSKDVQGAFLLVGATDGTLQFETAYGAIMQGNLGKATAGIVEKFEAV